MLTQQCLSWHWWRIDDDIYSHRYKLLLYNISSQFSSTVVFLEVWLKSDTCLIRKQGNWLWPSSIHPAKTVLATPSLSGKEQLRRSKTIGKKKEVLRTRLSWLNYDVENNWLCAKCIQFSAPNQVSYNTMNFNVNCNEFCQHHENWTPQHLSFTLRNGVGLCWSNP